MPRYCKGYCIGHYQQARRATGPLRPLLFTRGESLAERFWRNVDQRHDAAACWPWTGSLDDGGYGRFGYDSDHDRRAHQASWELHIGSIPDGLSVLHTCDNPPCVRPTHLFLGTPGDNAADRDAKGRTLRLEAHPRALIVRDDVIDIRTLTAMGATQEVLAVAYGMSTSNISAIVRRETWRDIP